MSWNNPKKKRGNAQAAPVSIDRMMRCEFCSVGTTQYGEKVGTPMIIEAVRMIPDEVILPNGRKERLPSVEIGTVVRCPNEASGKTYYNRTEEKWMRVCEKPPVFKPNEQFKALNVSPDKVYTLLRACHGSPSFYLDELSNGKLRQGPVPASIAELMRPKLNEIPKPPAQEPLPQEVMF